MKKLLVIIPTYNEALNVEAIVAEVFDVAKKSPKWVYEILIVDDNSPDGTSKIVARLQTKNKKLHLLTGAKEGYGKAYLRGFAWGLSKKTYDAFLMMDADFSHDPQDIPSLLAPILTGSDYVIGSRYVKGSVVASDYSPVRVQMSHGANFFAKLLLGTKNVGDFTGGFKAMSVQALKKLDLTDIKASGYVFQVSLLHEFSKHGFNIKEVPITFSSRRAGTSKMRLKDITEFFYLTYRLNPNSRIRRLVRFCFVGASGTVVNLAVISSLIHLAKWSALPADAVAIEVSIISNFLLNHFYTFRAAYTSPRTSTRDTINSMLLKLVKFNIVMLGGAAISFAVFVVCYNELGMPYVFADLLGILIALSWNYWLSVRVVWNLVDA